MSRWISLVLICGSGVLLGSSCPGLLPPGTDGEDTVGAQALFDEVWDKFDQNYSYFEYKDIDWDAVRTLYRPQFADDLTPDQFAEELVEMLSVLHDWHVDVKHADDTWVATHEGQAFQNAPAQLIDTYTTGGGYTKIGDNVIFHALLTGNIAHIVITTLDTSAWQSVSDAAIGNLFVDYQSAAAMIIDIRYNGGGNEENAKKIVSRLINATTLYGYHQTRNQGSDHSDFGELVEHNVDSSPNMHYAGPVVGLIGQRCMSSAEWFALGLREAGATLIGATTRGASANPDEFTLSNGVGYRVSRWIAYDSAMVEIEDHGVEPDITVPAESSFDGTHDYVLEAAINFLSP
jgi:hypothetical protein